MDTNNQPGPDGRPADPESRRGTRPSPEQKAARAEAAEARRSELSRKARTKNLIEMGGVAAAFGFSDPSQVEEILAALVRSKNGSARLEQLGVSRTSRWPSE